MNGPYLIAHVVRGEPAFDIAERMPCPECQERGEFFQRPDCIECDGDGYWWIIPTSGHRAYPFWNEPLSTLGIEQAPDGCWCWGWNKEGSCEGLIPIPADNWPDHYPTKSAKESKADPNAGRGLLAQLGLLKPTEPIKRRI